ncbi:MAG: hypothetical protein JW847_09330 [Candidatus Omnitrophica bacterium]|nr:hypothetical protein [Candidatus Omnitrophota bacterium]
MKGFEETLPLIAALLAAIVLFLGVITAIKKSLTPPSRNDTIDSTLLLKEQKRRMDDIQSRQKQFMRDQRQKIRDMQRL